LLPLLNYIDETLFPQATFPFLKLKLFFSFSLEAFLGTVSTTYTIFSGFLSSFSFIDLSFDQPYDAPPPNKEL